VRDAGTQLQAMGHEVDEVPAQMGGMDTLAAIQKLFFFGFKDRLDAYAAKTGLKPGPDSLEPAILSVYEWSATLTAADFLGAWGRANAARRMLSQFWATHDVWLSPTTARVSEPWGRYHLARPGVTAAGMLDALWCEPVQFTLPHNLMGTPAISLPLALHADGLPIGVQLGAHPAQEHLLLQVAAQLEAARPWAQRLPPLHASRLGTPAP
jgi:amidase